MDEDMILPEGFDGLPANEPTLETKEEPVVDLNTETVEEPTRESAEPVKAEQEPTQTEPQKIKLKFDREEREISVEEAAVLAQKGMNYEKAVERAAQQARDAVIADMGYTWNGKPITTESEFKQAKEEERIYQEVRKLAEKEGIPEEFAERMIKLEQRDAQRERETQQERTAKEEETKQQTAFNEFFQYFEEVNERKFDGQKDVLPQEVIDSVEKGQTLLSAYMKHHNKELRNQLKIAKQNQANVKKAPVGSVTAGGGIKSEPDDPFLQGFNSI